jgi:hypothetical protein
VPLNRDSGYQVGLRLRSSSKGAGVVKRSLATASLATLFLTLPFSRVRGQQISTAAAPTPAYQVGQVWKYKTAPKGEGSTILILKVESTGKKGNLIHIRVDNIPVPCGNLHITTSWEHVAITERALRESTTQLIYKNVGDLPDSYLRGWHESYPGTVDRPLSKLVLLPPTAPVMCGEARQQAGSRKR